MLALVRDMEKYEEGSEERAFKIALNLIKENVSTEIISRCSELPIEEIARIREEYSK